MLSTVSDPPRPAADGVRSTQAARATGVPQNGPVAETSPSLAGLAVESPASAAPVRVALDLSRLEPVSRAITLQMVQRAFLAPSAVGARGGTSDPGTPVGGAHALSETEHGTEVEAREGGMLLQDLEAEQAERDAQNQMAVMVRPQDQGHLVEGAEPRHEDVSVSTITEN